MTLTNLKPLKDYFVPLFALLCWTSAPAHADKIELGLGFFDIAATSATNSGSVSNLGLYYFGYRRSITEHLELALGYGILLTGAIGGEAGFGRHVAERPIGVRSPEAQAAGAGQQQAIGPAVLPVESENAVGRRRDGLVAGREGLVEARGVGQCQLAKRPIISPPA